MGYHRCVIDRPFISPERYSAFQWDQFTYSVVLTVIRHRNIKPCVWLSELSFKNHASLVYILVFMASWTEYEWDFLIRCAQYFSMSNKYISVKYTKNVKTFAHISSWFSRRSTNARRPLWTWWASFSRDTIGSWLPVFTLDGKMENQWMTYWHLMTHLLMNFISNPSKNSWHQKLPLNN